MTLHSRRIAIARDACNERTWMINADHIPIAHETDGLIFDGRPHASCTTSPQSLRNAVERARARARARRVRVQLYSESAQVVHGHMRSAV